MTALDEMMLAPQVGEGGVASVRHADVVGVDDDDALVVGEAELLQGWVGIHGGESLYMQHAPTKADRFHRSCSILPCVTMSRMKKLPLASNASISSGVRTITSTAKSRGTSARITGNARWI